MQWKILLGVIGVIGVYIAIGAAFNYYQGKRGTELVPPMNVWEYLPRPGGSKDSFTPKDDAKELTNYETIWLSYVITMWTLTNRHSVAKYFVYKGSLKYSVWIYLPSFYFLYYFSVIAWTFKLWIVFLLQCVKCILLSLLKQIFYFLWV